MSYALNYKASWVSNEGFSKSIRIFRENYTGEVKELDITNANLEFSKSDAPIDQVIKGKRLTLSVLTEGKELRPFKDSTRGEYIIIFTVDGQDRFSGFYENTGYFEKYGNDKYEIDLFFVDGFVFSRSLFYSGGGTSDIIFIDVLNEIFTAIDPQAILNASTTVEINENNNFTQLIDAVEYRFNYRNLFIREEFFNGKSYYQIINEIFESSLSNVFYVNNKLYSFCLINDSNRFVFNKYDLNGITESSFSLTPTNFNDLLFTDGYVVEFTDSYNRVELSLPYESNSKILGSAFDLSESNFIVTGTNSPDGSNYDIWDVNFLNNPDDTNIRIYKTSDKGIDFGSTPLTGGFAFVDSAFAFTGGITDRFKYYISGGSILNGSESFFSPEENLDTAALRQYYLFNNSFFIRKGSYLAGSYITDFNNFRFKATMSIAGYSFTDDTNKLIATCIPEIVVSGGDNLYFVFDRTTGLNSWLTFTEIEDISRDIINSTATPCYSSMLAEYNGSNEYEEIEFKFRIINVDADNPYDGTGEEAFFEIPDSVISEASLTPELIEIKLNFGITSVGADTSSQFVLINDVNLLFYDMEIEGSFTKIANDVTKQGQPFSKEIAIHTEAGFKGTKGLSGQSILAFNNQDYQRLNFPYTFHTVSGNFRKFPFANNDLTSSFQTLENSVISKVLSLSGKEKITFNTKGYIKENNIFIYEGNYYIISSQKINESDDNNTVQLIRIDE